MFFISSKGYVTSNEINFLNFVQIGMTKLQTEKREQQKAEREQN